VRELRLEEKGRRELQRGAHGEVGHGGVAMAAAVARGCASRSSPRLLWASRRRRGAGHVGLGAGRPAVARAVLGRARLSPSGRRSVACAGGAARAACVLEWDGDGTAQRGSSAVAAGAARQQCGSDAAARACALELLRAQGEQGERGRERGGRELG